VTVCHYPTGASKWNPVEHRLFSEISKHWAGQPLMDYSTIVRLIAQTREWFSSQMCLEYEILPHQCESLC